jgi:hypothetical protein
VDAFALYAQDAAPCAEFSDDPVVEDADRTLAMRAPAAAPDLSAEELETLLRARPAQ